MRCHYFTYPYHLGSKDKVYEMAILEYICTMNNTALNIIKRTVQSILPDSKILLFGSQAKGNSTVSSDYDLLIVTPRQMAENEKKVGEINSIKNSFIT